MGEIARHRFEHILNQIWTSLKIKNEVVDITKAGAVAAIVLIWRKRTSVR